MPRLLSTCILAATLASFARGGVLEWSPTLLTARLAPGQEEIALTFHVRNTGAAPVTVNAVEPSCGCTTAAMEPRVIPVGGTAQLRATYRAGGRSGTVHRDIVVKSDAGLDTVSFAIEHPDWFKLDRASLVWAPRTPRTEKSARLEIADGVAARLDQPRVEKPGSFTARLDADPTAPGRYLLRVAPLADASPLFSPIAVPVAFADGRTATITLHAALR